MIKGAVTQATTTGELAIRVVRLQATLFAEHVTRARSDPEAVHDTRVATRRLRAALRLFEDVLPNTVDVDAELRWMASQLGPVRDLDVQRHRLHLQSQELGLADALQPFEEWLNAQHAAAVSSFQEAFSSDRFVHLTVLLRGIALASPQETGNVPVEDDAPRRLQRAYRILRKRADDLCGASPPEAYHRARISAKRLRYAAEFFAALYGKPARRVIEAATDVQDLLGDHQDGVVDSMRIEEAVRSAGAAWPPETTLALGQLLQWEVHRGEELRAQFKPLYGTLRSAYRRLRQQF
jgi:CHAD domain-containing protein